MGKIYLTDKMILEKKVKRSGCCLSMIVKHWRMICLLIRFSKKKIHLHSTVFCEWSDMRCLVYKVPTLINQEDIICHPWRRHFETAIPTIMASAKPQNWWLESLLCGLLVQSLHCKQQNFFNKNAIPGLSYH